MSIEHREEDRYEVLVDAGMRGMRSDVQEVRVTNVSAHGCRFVSTRKMRVGSAVTVVVPRVGEVDARVKWRVGKVHGVRFEKGLHETVLNHIRLFLSKRPAYVAERAEATVAAA